MASYLSGGSSKKDVGPKKKSGSGNSLFDQIQGKKGDKKGIDADLDTRPAGGFFQPNSSPRKVEPR